VTNQNFATPTEVSKNCCTERYYMSYIATLCYSIVSVDV